MPDWVQWLAGPGLVALIAAYFNVRRKNRDQAAYDSGWERISKKERAWLERADEKVLSLEGDIKLKDHEISDLNRLNREQAAQILRLQFEKEALFERYAKAGIKAVAAMPAMRGVEVQEALTDSGFVDLSDD